MSCEVSTTAVNCVGLKNIKCVEKIRYLINEKY